MTAAPANDAPLVPVVLANQAFPAAVRVFDDASVASWKVATAGAEACVVKDDRDLETANSLAVALNTALKFIDKRDEELRRPLKQTMDAVRQVTDAVREPIDRAKRALVNKIGTFDLARKAAAEKLREEARAAHAAEVKRIADEKEAKAERDARELAEMMGETVPAAAAPPAPATKEPPASFASSIFGDLPAATNPPAAPAAPAVAAAVTVKRVPKLRITDFSKIPYRVGEEILMAPVESAILRVLKAGAKIEGAELVYEDQMSMRPQKEPDPHFG